MNRQACPHCGGQFVSSFYGYHIARCLARPDVLAAVGAALADPDNPGQALSVKRYDERAAALGLPASDTLRRTFGSWPTICARVGLAPGRRSGMAVGTRIQRNANQQAQEAAALADIAAMVQRDSAVRAWAADPGMEVCSVREIDGGRRVAYVLR